ncbi:MAG: ABC transporter ATP-binding protein, partial [bacterium]
IHALLGENGAGKSTLMSILFGLYQPDEGIIKINGQEVKINDPNDANKYRIGMVHQHFKLVHNFTVLENIILGVEETGFAGKLKTFGARKKVEELSKHYGLNVNVNAKIEDITVGMQQRVEILKMLYRDNDILIFDEPTAVLTPQEIDELMKIMKGLIAEGKSIIFITHKLNEIKAVADRCTIIRKGAYVNTVNVADVTKEQLSEMMVGHKVNFTVEKDDAKPTDVELKVEHLTYYPKTANKPLLNDVSFEVHRGEIVCIAGIDGNGQTELVYNVTGLVTPTSGKVFMRGQDITHASIRARNDDGMTCIPEDRHKHGLVLDYDLSNNFALKSYYKPQFANGHFLKMEAMDAYADDLIARYDVRSGEGRRSIVRGMSGGNQQKAIIAREIEEETNLLIAVQPVRGLDVGAIEFVHKKLIEFRDKNRAVLLVSLELDEVMNVSDRILVMYEGEIVGELDPKKTNIQELGLYMAGSKRGGKDE